MGVNGLAVVARRLPEMKTATGRSLSRSCCHCLPLPSPAGPRLVTRPAIGLTRSRAAYPTTPDSSPGIRYASQPIRQAIDGARRPHNPGPGLEPGPSNELGGLPPGHPLWYPVDHLPAYQACDMCLTFTARFHPLSLVSVIPPPTCALLLSLRPRASSPAR